MRPSSPARIVVRSFGIAAAIAAATYGGLAAWSWLRFGRAWRRTGDDGDPLLDRFMPDFDIVERHHIRVAAPAAVTLAAACELDLEQSALVRVIFRAREVLLGSRAPHRSLPRGLLPQVKALGWGVLAETQGQEIVMGAVTQPWQADVVFRALPPNEFAAFAEPGFVKIAWTLRADALDPHTSVFRTETRALATDPVSSARFRRYWSLVSPGIRLIRIAMLPLLKSEAERRVDPSRSRRPERSRAV
jgi:hypothetical protein